MKYEVLGLGNPIFDVIIHVDDLTVEELGLEKGSMNLVDIERQQEILNKCKTSQTFTDLGGSCANTMIMISQLGGKCAYSGKLGNDDFARNYESKLIEQGVSSFLRQQNGATGSTVILVTPDAERTMNTHLGMCQNFSKGDLNLKAIEDAEYIYIEGYQWDTPRQQETIIAAADHAKSVGTKIALTLSDLFCVERHKNEFQHLMDNYVELLFCNELEAAYMSEENDPAKQISQMSKSVDHIVLTLGKKGSRIFHAGETTDIDAFDAKTIDTTGAGDCFAAGYLFGITHDYSTKQAGILASYCAATIVGQNGPRFQGDLGAVVAEYMVN